MISGNTILTQLHSLCAYFNNLAIATEILMFSNLINSKYDFSYLSKTN